MSSSTTSSTQMGMFLCTKINTACAEVVARAAAARPCGGWWWLVLKRTGCRRRDRR